MSFWTISQNHYFGVYLFGCHDEILNAFMLSEATGKKHHAITSEFILFVNPSNILIELNIIIDACRNDFCFSAKPFAKKV